MVRDYVAEIESVRSRAAGNGRRLGSARITLELFKLATGPLKSSQLSDSDAAYTIVRLVTILEVFIRESVMEIVDAGSPYVERANALIGGGFRADFAVAAALAGQRVSFGELISHQISVNTLNDVSRTFSKLFDCSFLDELKSTIDRFSVEVQNKDPEPIIKHPSSTYKSIEDLLTCRHVLVHELPQNGHEHITQVHEKHQAVYDLVNAISEYAGTALHGNFPLTQSDMNISAAKSAAQADVELQQLLDTTDPKGENTFLEKSQQAWLNYRVLTAELIASVVQGGTLWSSLYSAAYEQITRVRISEIQKYVEST